jgi:LPS export ABC transporter protein LptC
MMIRKISYTLITIFILSWFVYVWYSPPESFLKKKIETVFQEDQIESFITDSTTQIFSNNGNQVLIMNASKLEILNGENIIKLYDPSTFGSNQDLSAIYSGFSMSSKFGTFDASKKELILSDSVKGTLKTKDEEQNIVAHSIQYNLPDMVISSDSQFSLTAENCEILGKGITINLSNGKTKISSSINSIYYVP